MLRVAIIGASGRLGSFAACLIEKEPEFELVARVTSTDDLGSSLRSSAAQIALDVTVAGLGAEHAQVMLQYGVRPVIGTSGVTPAETQELDELARAKQLGGIVVPNFSLGVCVQQKAAELAAEHLASIEIIETHHPEKRDAPSGTALDTARKLQAQTKRSVPIHSLRVPGVLANQEIVFGGRGEVLRMTHETYSLEAFSSGILASIRFAKSARGITTGLAAAIWPDES